MKNLEEIILKALDKAKTEPIDNIKNELLDEIHTHYDPVEAIKAMLRENKELYTIWQEAIAVNFKKLIVFNQVLEETPIVVFDEAQVHKMSMMAASNFLDLFSNIENPEIV